MTILSAAALCLALVLLLSHLISAAIAIRRCRVRQHQDRRTTPLVSVIRPVCGLENNLQETLRSTFLLDYPNYEILFGIADGADPALPLVRRLMDEFPHVAAKLLIGEVRISANPKLNNVVLGWNEAQSDWIVMADSNVLMPADYIQRLLAAWVPGTGLVCSPATGGRPIGAAAALECAFLNTYEVRWQYAAEAFGCGFAQGKNMLFRRDLVEAAGGLGLLGREAAEDAAATKLVRSLGLRVRLVAAPFIQPLGQRSFAAVWQRQVRWARLRRASFRGYYALELLTTPLWFVPCSVAIFESASSAAIATGISVAIWYLAEAALAAAAGWPLSWRSLPAMLLRDAALPFLWASGWLDAQLAWRGNTIRAAQSEA